jgi:adenylate cyclase
MAANQTHRRLTTILAADVAGYSRLTGADEEGTLSRIRALRSELIDPALSANRGRIVNTAGDSLLVEFASVVDAVRAAIHVQRAMVIRNADFVEEKRIEFRIGVHVGDVMVEHDGDLRGDGVNIAARLEGIAKPGGVCLSEDAYRQVKTKVDLAVTDLGEQRLKNIAEPVRAYSLQLGAPASAKPAAPKPRSKLAPLAAVLAALLIVVVGSAWFLFFAIRPATVATNTPTPAASTQAEPAHLSIVVLPFANLSGDPAQDYFADGITENLTTDLARIRGSFVIARNTAFTYKGKSVDAKEIGKELGVRYVLEGSVQRDGTRVRVNVQLVDAEIGAHLWAERFEEDVGDLFKLQDQVVARLANTLGNELFKAEAEKAARSKNPDVIDRARALSLQWSQEPQQTKEGLTAVKAIYEQALKIDPNDPDALAGDADTYAAEYAYNWRNPETDYDAKILGQADRAISLAPENVEAYMAKGWYMQNKHRWNEQLRAVDAGLAMNPNSALLYAGRVFPENMLYRFEQAKADAQQAMRLSPRDPQMHWWHIVLADAEFALGEYDAAIEEYQKVNVCNRGYCNYWDLAAAYAAEGKMDEAKAEVEKGRRAYPEVTVKSLKEGLPGVVPLWFEGLRKAGLPEE